MDHEKLYKRKLGRCFCECKWTWKWYLTYTYKHGNNAMLGYWQDSRLQSEHIIE